jgi:hypothetical protein
VNLNSQEIAMLRVDALAEAAEYESALQFINQEQSPRMAQGYRDKAKALQTIADGYGLPLYGLNLYREADAKPQVAA